MSKAKLIVKRLSVYEMKVFFSSVTFFLPRLVIFQKLMYLCCFNIFQCYPQPQHADYKEDIN